MVKYVVDILCCMRKIEIDSVLEALNKVHQMIKFSCEMEENKKINFLDMSLVRLEKRIRTCWYNKEGMTNVMLNLESNQPYKYNMMYNFIDRAVRLSD